MRDAFGLRRNVPSPSIARSRAARPEGVPPGTSFTLSPRAYNHDMDMSPLLDTVLKILIGFASAKIWQLYTRSRAHRAATALVGDWKAYEADGSEMEGAGNTKIRSAESQFREGSHLLSVEGFDRSSNRTHHGFIAIDPHYPWRAKRIVEYASGRPVEQNIKIEKNNKVLHIDEAPGGHNAHTLRLERKRFSLLPWRWF